MYCYDIHGIATVTSEVRLPELRRFRIPGPISRPTVSVRLGKERDAAASPPAAEAETVRRIHYQEALGSFGFWIDVEIGDTVRVWASPLLRWSPHVLYTNVVEPILRWTFVKLGWALVHAACIAFGEEAYIVTARTDTGKTTTILKILSRQRRRDDMASFISDDLTLVNPDGRVLTYPKPLTISSHTVAAVNTPLLSLPERFRLLYQSRLHSRGGRKTALTLSQSKLPMATANALVQFLIPPPKYHVQRLVPGVKLGREAHLAGMFIIERGGEGEVVLDEREALQILLENGEDAYGFPPYPAIAGFLQGAGDGTGDLRVREREIIAAALRGLPAMLVRSTTMDWAERIPRFLDGSGGGRASALSRAEASVEGAA